MKDNHIFRSLAAVAAHGAPLQDAAAAGKDVLQVRGMCLISLGVSALRFWGCVRKLRLCF